MLALGTALLWTAPAQAQEEAAPQASSPIIGDIIVSARRRNESS